MSNRVEVLSYLAFLNALNMRWSVTWLFQVTLVLGIGAQNAVEIATMFSASVVMVVVQDADHQNLALGSGLIVEDGKVITNMHVIEGARYAHVLGARGASFLSLEFWV